MTNFAWGAIARGAGRLRNHSVLISAIVTTVLFASCAPHADTVMPKVSSERSATTATADVFQNGSRSAYGLLADGQAYSCVEENGSCFYTRAPIEPGRSLYAFGTKVLPLHELERSAHGSFQSCVLEPHPQTMCSAETMMKATLGNFEVSLATSIDENEPEQDRSQAVYAFSEMQGFDTMRVTSSTLGDGTSVQIQDVLWADTSGMACTGPSGPSIHNTYGDYELTSSISGDGVPINQNENYYEINCSVGNSPGIGSSAPMILTVLVGDTYKISDDSLAQDSAYTIMPWDYAWSDALNDIKASDTWSALTPGVTLHFASGGTHF